MSKKVDWTGKGAFGGQPSEGGALKRKFMDLAAKEEGLNKSNQELAAMRPQLKQVLTWFMNKRKPFEVVRPFGYQTEALVKANGRSSFTTVNAVAKPGTTLTFKSLLKSTSQFLFEDQDGEEVAIYSSDVLVGGRHGMMGIPNSGLNGLLYNTEIYETLLKLKENK